MCSHSIFYTQFSKILLNNDIRNQDLGVEIAFPRFQENLIFQLLNQALPILKKLPIIYDLKSYIYIVGDLHGNIRDLIRILKHINFLNTEIKILFLGDYVDKGEFSIEVITLLFSLLLQFPDRVFLLRGNHEFESVNLQYGFKSELFEEYKNDRIWERFNTCFNYLPIAAIIDNKYFCIHASISPQLKSIDQISTFERPITSFRQNSILTDLMWGDPDPNVSFFCKSKRGYGHSFGQSAIDEFCKETKIEKMIRSHQCIDQGSETTFCEKVITVFSCSNYCDKCKNKAAILFVHDDKIDETLFDPLEILPRSKAHFEDVFQ